MRKTEVRTTRGKPTGSPRSRYDWTSGGTTKENFRMLTSVTQTSETLTTLRAPLDTTMISNFPPLVRNIQPPKVVAREVTKEKIPLGQVEETQRTRFPIACQFIDGSIKSKMCEANRVLADVLVYKFAAEHSRKTAFLKAHRGPNPMDEDYDAFAEDSQGPFDLNRPLTDIDFQQVAEADQFDSHYAEIFTLFTDDSFVKQLSVGGEVDRELLRTRSQMIMKSGGAILDVSAAKSTLRRKSSIMGLRGMPVAQEIHNITAPQGSTVDTSNGEGKAEAPVADAQEQASQTEQAKKLLFQLFTQQSMIYDPGS